MKNNCFTSTLSLSAADCYCLHQEIILSHYKPFSRYKKRQNQSPLEALGSLVPLGELSTAAGGTRLSKCTRCDVPLVVAAAAPAVARVKADCLSRCLQQNSSFLENISKVLLLPIHPPVEKLSEEHRGKMNAAHLLETGTGCRLCQLITGPCSIIFFNAAISLFSTSRSDGLVVFSAATLHIFCKK